MGDLSGEVIQAKREVGKGGKEEKRRQSVDATELWGERKGKEAKKKEHDQTCFIGHYFKLRYW